MSMDVVTVSMPPSLRERIDEFAVEHGYDGRSAVVREGTRSLLTEFEDETMRDQSLTAIVAIQFRSSANRIDQQLSQVRHSRDKQVLGHVHQCLTTDACLEVYILSNGGAGIAEFVQRVRGIRNVENVEYVLLPLDATAAHLPSDVDSA